MPFENPDEFPYPDRLAAYFYMKTGNSAFSDQAIKELTANAATSALDTEKIIGPEDLNPFIEAWRVNSNQVAQWSLIAIEILEMASDQIPRQIPE